MSVNAKLLNILIEWVLLVEKIAFRATQPSQILSQQKKMKIKRLGNPENELWVLVHMLVNVTTTQSQQYQLILY